MLTNKIYKHVNHLLNNHDLFTKLTILPSYALIRTFSRRSCSHDSTVRRSGYESETAEIKDSFENFRFDFDTEDCQEERRVPQLSHSKPLRSEKVKSLNIRTSEFIDFRRVHVKGGDGGNGMICFLKLWSNPMAGPSGGDGGNGGHVIFETCKNVKSLNCVRSSYVASIGEKGQHKDMNGANAMHAIVKLPIGTLVKDAYTRKLIADMNQADMKFLAAKGGAGGKGNHYFLSNQNRHPYVAELGGKGEAKSYILELKMIAHAGLIGFPNAGKSTLLNAVSRARPKVASYPFTTLKPTVGIIQYDDDEQLAVADLPGLIEDAHLNKGLGISFLRHIDRCVCLFYVIDLSIDEPYRQLRVLMNELEQYNSELSKRPVAIIANKVDTDGAENKLHSIRKRLKEDDLQHLRLIPVSAKYGQNLSELLTHFRELYDLYRYEKFTKDI